MVFSPFYENYGADAILSGAEPIYIPLVPPAYDFDITLIERGFQEGAKAIIICNPSNPCGKVFSYEELEAIGKLAIKYDAFVVTDEVYEYLVYAPYKHTCMAALPGSSFFREEVNHLIRLHFARNEKTLEEALRRLEKLSNLIL